jgi:hypothetical protein
MKHIKLFENYVDQEEKDLLDDLADLGFNLKRWRILFDGVIPNGDDFAGNWSIVTREIQTDSYSPEKALRNIRDGSFEVILEERDEESYLGESFKKSKIIEIAQLSSDLEEFWEEINKKLYEAGEEAYIAQWGDEEDEDDEDEDGEYPYGKRVNMEAFSEIWYSENSKPNIIVENI